MSLEVELQNPNHYDPLPTIEQLTQWANAALQKTHSDRQSVVVRVVNIEEGRQLNHDYRGKAYATNILSFPFEAPPPELMGELAMEVAHLGDLVLCQVVLNNEAIQQHKTLLQHWAHLLVHGVLHLQGFNHISETEAEQMEALEIMILGKLGFDNPYIEFTGDNET
jgi:probable rRNA maturation factor